MAKKTFNCIGCGCELFKFQFMVSVKKLQWKKKLCDDCWAHRGELKIFYDFSKPSKKMGTMFEFICKVCDTTNSFLYIQQHRSSRIEASPKSVCGKIVTMTVPAKIVSNAKCDKCGTNIIPMIKENIRHRAQFLR